IDQEDGRRHAKQAQSQLSTLSAETQAESHPFIFHKMDPGPRQPEDAEFFTIYQMCLDPDLQSLVGYQHQGNDQHNEGLSLQAVGYVCGLPDLTGRTSGVGWFGKIKMAGFVWLQWTASHGVPQ